MSQQGSGWYTGSAGEWSATGVTFDIKVDATTFNGWEKLGGTNPILNTVDAPAVRQKKFTATTVNLTSTTIAHGLGDDNGNPAIPVAGVQLQGPAAGDVMVSTSEPDSVNLYLSATAAGAYDFLVLY